MNRYEIGDLNKLPTNLSTFEALLDDLVEPLTIVQAHPKNPLLHLYDYSKELARIKTQTDHQSETFKQEVDIGKKNPLEAHMFFSMIQNQLCICISFFNIKTGLCCLNMCIKAATKAWSSTSISFAICFANNTFVFARP